MLVTNKLPSGGDAVGRALSTWLGLSGIGACRGSVGWASVGWGQAAAVSPVTSFQTGESSRHFGAIVVSGEAMAAGF